jgi:hypothetical protein
MNGSFFSSAPLWLVLLITLAALCITAGIGMAFSSRRAADPEDNTHEGYLLSATLALLGLLVGFTFSMTLARYDKRRETVVVEANAIGTAWLRAGLVEGPIGDRLRSDMHAYGQQRLHLPDQADTAAAEAQSGALQTRLWADTRAAIPTLQAPIAATLITSMNDMFDAASSRRAEREARIPALVLDTLMASLLASAAMVGYVLGGKAGRRHAVVTLLLFLLLALAITMILDLDRPWTGFIRVPMAPLEQAVAAMG